jgi:hypothetical protein
LVSVLTIVAPDHLEAIFLLLFLLKIVTPEPCTKVTAPVPILKTSNLVPSGNAFEEFGGIVIVVVDVESKVIVFPASSSAGS